MEDTVETKELKENKEKNSIILNELFRVMNFCVDDFEISGHPSMLTASKDLAKLIEIMGSKGNE